MPPEKCPSCGARGGMRLMKVTSGPRYDPDGDRKRMIERIRVVIKKHGRKLDLP